MQTSGSQQLECEQWSTLRYDGLDGIGAEVGRLAELRGLATLQARMARRPSLEAEDKVCSAAWTMAWSLRAPQADSDGSGPQWRMRPVEMRNVVHSAFPVDRSNGTMWGGKGVSSMASAGVDFRWGPLSSAVALNAAVQQNLDFEIQDTLGVNRSPFAYPWHHGWIDWPQRFGDQSFTAIDAGQSYLRVDAGLVSVGVSNENLWWGPAVRYPIVLGNTAPGFPHLLLGTHEGWDRRKWMPRTRESASHRRLTLRSQRPIPPPFRSRASTRILMHPPPPGPSPTR